MSYIWIDEKIKVFQEFRREHKDEKIVGKTVYKGYPIGQWAIQIRSAIKKKELILTEQRERQWSDLGILERQIDSTIDEKIDALVNWSTKYPLARLSDCKASTKYLKLKSKSQEEFLCLMDEYEKLRNYYEYIKQRNCQKHLSQGQIQKLMKGNVGGVFLDYDNIEKLSERYRISKKKMYTLIDKYSHIDVIKKMYKNILAKKSIDDKSITNISYNLRKTIDIRLSDNTGFETLFLKITDGAENIIYDSQALLSAINNLDDRLAYVIKQVYGLESGIPKSQGKLSQELNVSDSRVQQLVERAIKKLKKGEYSKTYIIDAKKRFGLTNKDVINLFISTDYIFYPDQEYVVSPNQTHEELMELIKDKSLRTSMQNNVESLIKRIMELDEKGIDISESLPEEVEREENVTPQEKTENRIFKALNRMMELKQRGIDIEKIFSDKNVEDRIKLEILRLTNIKDYGFPERVREILETYGIVKIGQLLDLSTDYEHRIFYNYQVINEVRKLKNRPECRALLKEEKKREEEIFSRIKDKPIGLCGFDLMINNVLRQANIITVEKLLSLTPEQIKEIEGIGFSRARIINEKLYCREKFIRDLGKKVDLLNKRKQENSNNSSEITGEKIGQAVCEPQAIAASNEMDDVLRRIIVRVRKNKKEEK